MPTIDLYEHGEQKRNLAHFAALASLAARDGVVSPGEKKVLDRFAIKLNISDSDYEEVMKAENKYPILTTGSAEKRLMRLFDLFTMVLADHKLDGQEQVLLEKYAVGLGYSVPEAEKLVSRAFNIFCGKIDFEDFQYLINRHA